MTASTENLNQQSVAETKIGNPDDVIFKEQMRVLSDARVGTLRNSEEYTEAIRDEILADILPYGKSVYFTLKALWEMSLEPLYEGSSYFQQSLSTVPIIGPLIYEKKQVGKRYKRINHLRHYVRQQHMAGLSSVSVFNAACRMLGRMEKVADPRITETDRHEARQLMDLSASRPSFKLLSKKAGSLVTSLELYSRDNAKRVLGTVLHLAQKACWDTAQKYSSKNRFEKFRGILRSGMKAAFSIAAQPFQYDLQHAVAQHAKIQSYMMHNLPEDITHRIEFKGFDDEGKIIVDKKKLEEMIRRREQEYKETFIRGGLSLSAASGAGIFISLGLEKMAEAIVLGAGELASGYDTKAVALSRGGEFLGQFMSCTLTLGPLEASSKKFLVLQEHGLLQMQMLNTLKYMHAIIEQQCVNPDSDFIRGSATPA